MQVRAARRFPTARLCPAGTPVKRGLLATGLMSGKPRLRTDHDSDRDLSLVAVDLGENDFQILDVMLDFAPIL